MLYKDKLTRKRKMDDYINEFDIQSIKRVVNQKI